MVFDFVIIFCLVKFNLFFDNFILVFFNFKVCWKFVILILKLELWEILFVVWFIIVFECVLVLLNIFFEVEKLFVLLFLNWGFFLKFFLIILIIVCVRGFLIVFKKGIFLNFIRGFVIVFIREFFFVIIGFIRVIFYFVSFCCFIFWIGKLLNVNKILFEKYDNL